MRLIVVRHGESEGNAAGIVQGSLDFGLTELGLRQAEATAERLRREKVARVLSSPLKRALQTAEALALGTGLEVEAEEGLREYDIGAVSGLTPLQIRERYPEVAAAYARGERPLFPGEEGREPFHLRVRCVLESLREAEGTVVAVAHGGVVGAICAIAAGIPSTRRGLFEAANCSISELVRDRTGRLVILRSNDVCHLDGLVTRADRG